MSQINIASLNLLFSCLSHFSSTIFWVRSADFKKQLYVSPSYEKLYGNPCEQLYQHPEAWADTIITDEKDKIIQLSKERIIHQINNKNDIDPFFYKVILPNGYNHFIKNNSFPIRDENQNILAFFGFSEGLLESEWELMRLEKNHSHSNISQLAFDMGKLIQNDLSHNPPTVIIKPPKENPALSRRERECLSLLLEGKSAKQSGRVLNLSPRTIETYLDAIKQKFGCRTKLEIIGKLQQWQGSFQF